MAKTAASKPKKRSVFRRIVMILLILFALLLVLAAAFFTILTILEYRPDDVESIAIRGPVADERLASVSQGETLRVATWNLGYGALGDNADFFMDGGSMVMTADKERVEKNLKGISETLQTIDPDIFFAQEIDLNSDRSYHIDETENLFYSGNPIFPEGADSMFACNFRAAFIPYPIPPIGKVNSGILTVSSYAVSQAQRISLPCPFSWPVRTVNLKRCLLVSRMPVAGSEHELVLVNLHLEAYDDGEGKVEQTKMLADFLSKEAGLGNYVIVGGDFNQTFSSVDSSAYPMLEGNWHAGSIEVTDFPDGFSFYMDPSVPSGRSILHPLATAQNKDPQHFQYYMIDGFIVSDNLDVENCETLDYGFVCTDHNPVVLTVSIPES